MTLATRPVTATLREPETKTPLVGTVTFTPGGGVLVDPVSGRILAGADTQELDGSGAMATTLVPTDTTGIQPAANTWNWNVTFNLKDSTGAAADIPPFNFALPTGSSAVDLSTVIQLAPLAGTYLVIPGPTGPKGDKGDPGSGGAADRTARIRIIDDNLSGLPAAASWVVAVTSSGTPLQCKIKAVLGDRIELYPNWMREGSHFTDHVILKADGTIWGYASADGGPTPGIEGNPDMYPALNESYVTSADEFTVAAENIDGSGFITIGVAHQGTGAGKVFAHPVYPWRLRLKNIGPQPAP